MASRYDYEDDTRVLELGRQARVRGWFARDEFIEIGDWKSPRIRSRAARNSSSDVENATRSALAHQDPLDAINALRVLHGVEWAVASVFLHLGHKEPLPILDFRALEAFGVDRTTSISSELWLGYVAATRGLARSQGVDMRTLDRALWRWSKEQTSVAPRAHRNGLGRPVATVRRMDPSASVDVVILGCVSSKRRQPGPAKDLYVSPLWQKRRSYAEQSGRPWVIYSAKHGILNPDDWIEWYDVALSKLPSAIRRAKGVEAVGQLERQFGPLRGKTFEIHAGSAYADSLGVPLANRGAVRVNPVQGLSIGYQLQWYGRR
jgi:hypothetical protein